MSVTYANFAGRFPFLSYRKIENLASYTPEETTFYLRSRAFTGTAKQIPSSESMLQADVAPLASWIHELLSPAMEALCLEPLAEEEADGPAGRLPSFASFAKQLQVAGRVLVPEGSPSEPELYHWAASRLGEQVEVLIGTAARVVSFLLALQRRGQIRMTRPLRYAVLTGIPEIETLFGPEVRRLAPHLQVREYYAAAEGVFSLQPDSLPGLSFQQSNSFFELEAGTRVFPINEARRGESGSLIVSTAVFPRYRIGDLLFHLGGGRWRVLGKDGRTTRFGYFLKHIFPG